MKCQNEACCGIFQTDWLGAFPDRFIPFSAVYEYKSNGPVVDEPSVYANNPKKFELVQLTKRLLVKKTPVAGKEYDEVSFDLYCPSMQEKLTKDICKLCKRYWPSAAEMIRHKKCQRKSIENELEMESEDSGSERESELDEESSND